MSNQPFPPKSVGSNHNHLQSERMISSMAAPHQLPNFAAATANGYHPRPQMTTAAYPSASASNTNNTPQQANSTSSATEFSLSAYIAALEDPNPFQPLAPQPIDLNNFKGLKFVTLDPFMIETRKIYDAISGTFRWEMCETQDDRCLNFIRDECPNKRVFLISSGGLGKEIIPKIHDLPQLYAVYIFCSDIKFHLPWANKYSKIRVVCNDDDRHLLPRLAVDVAQANIDWGNALLQKGNRDKAKEKFESALKNLNEHAKKPDPAMIKQVTNKLAECK